MWRVTFLFLLLHLNSIFAETNSRESKVLNLSRSEENTTTKINGEKMKEIKNFIHELAEMTVSVTDYIINKKSPTGTSSFLSLVQSLEEDQGRGMKRRRREIRFLMKTILVVKVILGLFIPFGIIVSKMLSWKAVTLSMMSLILAKIMFFKNILSGQKTSTILPHYPSPVFVNGAPHDPLWKRQNDNLISYT